MYKKLLLGLFALPLLLSPSVGNTSPPIRIRSAVDIDKATDVVLRVKILRRKKHVKGVIRTTRIRVKVVSARVFRAGGGSKDRLRRGAIMEFSRSCSLLKLRPSQRWRTGYPNSRCSSGYGALPSALTRAKGKTVMLRLRRILKKGKKTRYETVPTTFPITTWAQGRRIK